MNHLKTGNAFFGGSYKSYKFQEQELQETGMYSFKWREYMPDIGRFIQIDPLAEKYPTWGSYVFSGNRVIDAREIEGLEPKVLFNTRENAAANFGQQYNGKSILKKREYMAFIYFKYVDGEKYYAYNTPVKGNAHGIPKNKINKSIPKGSFLSAYIHTHGNEDLKYDDENFSGSIGNPEGDIGYASQENLDAFLVTPGGLLNYFDVSSGTQTTLKKNMPSDPNSPQRQNIIDPTEVPIPSEGDLPKHTPKRYPNLTEPKLDGIFKSIKDNQKREIPLINKNKFENYHR